MKKLIVVGAAGRMGKRITALAVESGSFQIIGAVENSGNPEIGKDAGLAAGIAALNVKISDSFAAGSDAVIDFTTPAALQSTIDYCVKNKSAMVIGTTGLSPDQQAAVKKAGEQIPVIYGTNMSVGMNVLFALVGKAAQMLGEEYDIEIVEEHHRFKKDSPSGSALSLAESICKSTGRKYPDCLVHGREGKDALRKKGDIGMHAVRAGDIVGVHNVMFSTLGETVTIGHDAHSRDNFARGAVRAAGWLIGKKAGLYTMADCLGIK